MMSAVAFFSFSLLVLASVLHCNGAPQPVFWSLLQPASSLRDHGLKFQQTGADLEQAWTAFKADHNKRYSSVDEENQRKQIFAENCKKIELNNYLYSKGKKSYKMAVNKYSDMSHSEFVRIMNGWRNSTKTRQKATTYLSPSTRIQLPDSVDWRNQGYVTPVKDQGQCGSCWSFSTTGSLEGQTFRKTGNLVSLSEQNLIDCSGDYGNKGCDGGDVDPALNYIKDNGGIDTEDSYPYEGQMGSCRYDPQSSAATVSGITDIPQGDESKLQEAVANVGPISVAIDASHDSFQQYSSGIYDEPACDPSKIDHAVLVVGYGTSQDGVDYWLVKNSWGTSWGIDGYIMMSRNKDNQCGIASAASYPLV